MEIQVFFKDYFRMYQQAIVSLFNIMLTNFLNAIIEITLYNITIIKKKEYKTPKWKI